MNAKTYIDLEDCSEFRQALRAQTPAIVHGTAALVILTVAAAITWMAVTQADLIVTGSGRVRTLSETDNPDDQISREVSSERDGRVHEVHIAVGDEVTEGDVLVRLDTTQLDLKIAKMQASIRAAEDKIEEMDRSLSLLAERHAAAGEKAQAEILQAAGEAELAKQRRGKEITLATIALTSARDKAARMRTLDQRGAVAAGKLVEALGRLREAEENLKRAQLPLPNGKVETLRRSLPLAKADYALEKHRLVVARRQKKDEIRDASYDLAQLQLQKGQSVIRAACDAIVTKAEVKAGDIVRAGKLGITIARRRGFEFELMVSSADVGQLRVEMPVRIKLDAYDYQKYGTLPGKVRSIAPDSTLKQIGPGQQLAVYKVKVSLAQAELRRGDHRGRIKLGMSGEAQIVTDRESLLKILVRRMRQKISLG